MGGNRKGSLRRKFNVFVVFLLSGLWHGANWTFVIWGLLHGLVVIFFTRKAREEREERAHILTVRRTLEMVSTFVVVTFFWIFFRSPNVTSAWLYIKKIFSFIGGANYVGVNRVELLFSIALIAIMMLRERLLPRHLISNDKRFYAFAIAMTVICYYLGVFRENQFIYFQF
jgi:D-alanyl-lipoteichoic acid acyltransferase DltB (MBOAT superfamily)